MMDNLIAILTWIAGLYLLWMIFGIAVLIGLGIWWWRQRPW